MSYRREFLAGAGGSLVGAIGGVVWAGYLEDYERERQEQQDLNEKYEQGAVFCEDDYSEEVRSKARQVAARVTESTLKLEPVYSGNSIGGGAGWFFDSQGTFLTNRHIVEDAESLRAWTSDGREYSAEVLEMAGHDDIAVCSIDEKSNPLTETAPMDELSEGQPLVAVGNPPSMGNWVTMLGSFLETRTLTGFDDEYYERQEIVSSVPAVNGMSGSATVTLEGDVVGTLYSHQPPDGGESPTPDSTVVHEQVEYTTITNHVPTENAKRQLEKYP